MTTGVPSIRWAFSTLSAEAVTWRQPADSLPPIEPGMLVPWMATWSPPVQPGGRLGWRPERPNAYQPYGPDGSPVETRSVTLKRPVGVGESGAPRPTGNDATTLLPLRSRRRCVRRVARTHQVVWRIWRPASVIHPVRLLGSPGRMTRPQEPLGVVDTAHAQVGVPSCVVVGIDPDAGPPGHR
jgi:hypothetical protein